MRPAWWIFRWAGARRHHQFRSNPCRPLDRSVPPAAECRIVINAHRINRGEMPEWPQRGEDLGLLVRRCEPEGGAAKDVELARSYSAAVRPRPDPRHPGSRSHAARRSGRAFAQRRSSEGAQSKPSAGIEKFGSVFAPGDKIMQTGDLVSRTISARNAVFPCLADSRFTNIRRPAIMRAL
jgi:hypothetical protein